MPEPIRLAIAPSPEAFAAGCTLSAKLERRFGLGAQPAKRRALYLRLELLVNAMPELEVLVKEAASQATSARFPDRYFCSAVVKKLRESKLLPDL